jgi:hypothetical protein
MNVGRRDNESEDAVLLRRAAEWRINTGSGLPDPAAIEQLTASAGIDFATAVLYDAITHCPPHAAFLAELDAQRSDDTPLQVPSDTLLAVAAGAFYLEYPHSGADGRLLREQAAALGCPCELIPSASMGSLAENAELLCQWLAARGERRIILASISKGGSDITAALRRPEAPKAFRNVMSWISLCGILDGSPTVDWLLRSRLRELSFRGLFWWRGLRFQVLTDLRHSAGGPLDGPLDLPATVRLIQIVGFPLRRHLTNRLARTCHAAAASAGPNDGVILLTDVVRQPGLIYPIWGADHYLRPSWELRRLASSVLRYVLETQSLDDTAPLPLNAMQ